MAVTTTKTNKPINPRGNDQSPKGFNRASLFSGKALDFDGTNDELSIDGFTMSGNTATISFYLKADDWDANSFIFAAGTPEIVIGSTTGGNNLSFYDSSSWKTFGTISDTTSTNFFSIVFDGTTAIAYMNGVKFGDTLTITAIDLSSVTGVKLMAKYIGGAWFFNGQLSGFKIFNTALTATQVADLYNNPEKIVPTGVADSALKLWLPMMEGAGTTAYDGSAPLTDYVTNGDFSDGTNNWTASNATLSVEGGALKITSTGGNRPQANQTITGLTIGRKYLLSAVARVGTTSYNMEIEIAGIGATGSYNKTTNSTDTYIYYEFTASSTSHQIQAKIDNDPVPIGETGYFDDIKLLDLGNYGTISGATWVQGVGAPVAQSAVIDWNKMVPDHTNEILVPQGLTAGRDLLGNLFENVRKQGALNLDGNSWAEVHDNASLDITDAITLEAWYYHTGSGTKIIQGRWSTQVDNSYLMYVEGNKIKFVGNDGSSTFGGNNSTTDLNSDQFNHIVITYDRTNLKYYLNGVLIDTFAYTVSLNPNASVVLDIGRNDGTSGVYNGSNYNNTPIAQPRIYNRALTAEEVQRNYDAGKNIYS